MGTWPLLLWPVHRQPIRNVGVALCQVEEHGPPEGELVFSNRNREQFRPGQMAARWRRWVADVSPARVRIPATLTGLRKASPLWLESFQNAAKALHAHGPAKLDANQVQLCNEIGRHKFLQRLARVSS